jgi:kynureninase
MFEIKSKKIGIFSDIHLGLGQDSKQWHDISLDFAKWASNKFLDAGITVLTVIRAFPTSRMTITQIANVFILF